MANINQTQCFDRVAALLKRRVPAFTASVKTTTTLSATPNNGFGLSDSGISALAAPLQNEFSAEGLELSSGELAFAKPDTVWELAGVVCERVRNVSASEVKGAVIGCIKAVLGGSPVVKPETELGNGGLGLSDKRKRSFAKELKHVFTTLIRLNLSGDDLVAETTVQGWINLCSTPFSNQDRL